MGTVEQEGVSACRRCHDALQPGASPTSVSSGPAAASVPWRRAGSGGPGAAAAAQGPPPLFGSSPRDPVRMPSCLSNHNKASPLQSQLLSSHVPVCIALSTSPVSSAPSAQMASRPRWFLRWSQLPLAPPVLGSFLQGPLTGLDPAGL